MTKATSLNQLHIDVVGNANIIICEVIYATFWHNAMALIKFNMAFTMSLLILLISWSWSQKYSSCFDKKLSWLLHLSNQSQG